MESNHPTKSNLAYRSKAKQSKGELIELAKQSKQASKQRKEAIERAFVLPWHSPG